MRMSGQDGGCWVTSVLSLPTPRTRFIASVGNNPSSVGNNPSSAGDDAASAGDNAASVGDDAAASSPTTLDTPQPESAQETEEPSGKKRGKKKGRVVNVEEILPKPSYWPLALAVSFVVLLMGIMISWIVIVIGAILLIASVIGWSLERR